MSLNPNQKNAVKYTNGPCLILAGAGSGKTKVIVHKIIYLINHCQYHPNNITAVTFTNKSAYEMRVRLSEKLNTLVIKKMIISTFHSLGLEIIKQEIDALELDSNFTLIDEKDQIALLKKLCSEEIENNAKFFKKINFMISNWKNKFYTPSQALLLAHSHVEKKFALIYQKYADYLREFNMLDFDDLICLPTLLLKKNVSIQKRWQEKISYLLVDEYQDTNNSQYEFIKILTSTHSNFTLVGDDDQSIYSWRGADPKNIFLLKKDFPHLKIITMEHNYRSSGRILKAANSLISHNTHHLKKKLFSKLQYGSYIQVIIGQNEENEAEKIAKKISQEYLANKVKYEDYAILYRGNYQSRIIEKILIKKNIPYNISENSSFFSRPEIKDLLSYLRVIINPNDNSAFRRIINTPTRKIGIVTLNKLENLATKKNTSLFQASNDIEVISILKKTTVKALQKFISWIEKNIQLFNLQPFNILKNIISDIKYEKWLSKIFKEPNKIKNSIDNIHTLSQWIQNMLEGNKFEQPMTLKQIVSRMTLRDIVDKNIQNNNHQDKVQLMTLHASKGLEFPSVFITGMCEGVLPNHKSINDNNIEEERRLTYVGITRAKKQLFFTYCDQRTQYGQILNMLPSRFLFELPKEDLQWEKNIALKPSLQKIKKNQLQICHLKKILKKYRT